MYGMNGGIGGGFNVWTWIILILIVLQWFRVGGVGGIGGPGGPGPEPGLVNNGGLFIIAIFLLVACGCFKMPLAPIAPARYC
jgi:hypothetical protein